MPKSTQNDFTWFCGNDVNNVPKDVAQKLPNGFGLYDMHGNIREWVNDSDTINGSQFPSSAIDPIGDLTHPNRGIRGGSSGDLPSVLAHSTFLSGIPDTTSYSGLGFRLVITQ